MEQIKTREELFEKIEVRLVNEGFISENDYGDEHDALINDLAICIGKELDSYTIVEGVCKILEPERKKSLCH